MGCIAGCIARSSPYLCSNMEDPNAELNNAAERTKNNAAEMIKNAEDGEFNSKKGRCSLQSRC
jgi:hypothetical protein